MCMHKGMGGGGSENEDGPQFKAASMPRPPLHNFANPEFFYFSTTMSVGLRVYNVT